MRGGEGGGKERRRGEVEEELSRMVLSVLLITALGTVGRVLRCLFFEGRWRRDGRRVERGDARGEQWWPQR